MSHTIATRFKADDEWPIDDPRWDERWTILIDVEDAQTVNEGRCY